MLSDNHYRKSNLELIEIHKRVITNWLHLHSAKLKVRRKFFIVYDFYIDWKNIRHYYNLPIRVFIVALLQDKLDKVKNYYPTIKTKKHGKRSKK